MTSCGDDVQSSNLWSYPVILATASGAGKACPVLVRNTKYQSVVVDLAYAKQQQPLACGVGMVQSRLGL